MKRVNSFSILLLSTVGAILLIALQPDFSLIAIDLNSDANMRNPAATGGLMSAFSTLTEQLRTNFQHPLSRLLLQLMIIMVAARLTGKLFMIFGQPAVVGEMASGILLGPSFFGLFSPDIFAAVFPQESLGSVRLLSQIGVFLFMFDVGMKFDLNHLRSQAYTAAAVSYASILIPFLLGMSLAYYLFNDFAAHGTSFMAFALFMGISMSITAFPVLARIIQERGMSHSSLGNTAITCAAVNDVIAWSLLAFAVAITKATGLGASVFNLLLVLIFIIIMVFGVRPGLPCWIGNEALMADEPTKETLAITLCLAVASALSTELMGIHALFGAFLAGAVMPESREFRHKISMRVENLSSVLLMPLFFTFTGLQTQLGLLNNPEGLGWCFLIILIATIGKLGGTAVAAHLTGMSWRESLQLGALMNTRGLMELVALNIGYDLGILSPRIFTIMVTMAIVTTMLTGPLLTLFGQRRLSAIPCGNYQKFDK